MTGVTGDDGRDARLPAAVEAFTGARADDAVFVVGPDYRVAYWDARTELITGLPASEVVGRPLYEALVGEREDGTSFCRNGCPVMGLARAGRSVPSHEVRLRPPSGAARWVGVTFLVVETEEGPYLVGLLRDSQRMHETLEMARALIRLSEGRAPDNPAGQAPELTSRQLAVLHMLASGGSVKSIARELGIAEATARGHVQALLRAFGVRSQIEALARARQAGLLSG